MVVGILESQSDRFIKDVISQLSGASIEFVSLGAEKMPVERGYEVLVDRLSFGYPFLREIVKNLCLSGTYVISNPFTASTTNKLVDIRLGDYLGLPFPRTLVLPDQTSLDELSDLVKRPDMGRVVEEIGLPCILKPFDGYAWQDVYVIKTLEELQERYTALSPRYVLLAQHMIKYNDYFRVFCFDKKDVLFIRWIPKPLSMGHYTHCDQNGLDESKDKLIGLTTALNEALDLDVNVVEWCRDEEGKWWMIDAFNEVPEVIPEALPTEDYTWIVDRFAACIKNKLNSGKKNRTPFWIKGPK